MTMSTPFDSATPCTARAYVDLWKPYAYEGLRKERDLLYCRSEREYYRSNVGKESIITRREFIKVFQSTNFANYQGYLLNAMLTLNWNVAGYSKLPSVEAAYRQFMSRVEKYMSYRNIPTLYYTVFENTGPRGVHSHTSIHIPNRIRTEFRQWLRRTLVSADGQLWKKGWAHLYAHDQEYIYSQWQWFKYCMKGLDPCPVPEEARAVKNWRNWSLELLGVRHKWGGSLIEWADGPICTLKRVRISRALSVSAQEKAKYQPPKMHWGQIYDDSEYINGKKKRGCYSVFSAM